MAKTPERSQFYDKYLFPFENESQKDTLIGDFEKNITQFKSHSFDEPTISQAAPLGDFNFGKLVPGIQLVASLLDEVLKRDISRLPPSRIKQISVACKTASHWMERVERAKEQNELRDYVRTTSNEITKEIESQCNTLIELVAYTGAMEITIAPITKAADECEALVAKSHGHVNEAAAKLKKFHDESTKLLNACQDRLQQTVVSKQAERFEDLAKKYSTAAHCWLLGVIGTAALIVGTGITFYVMAVKQTSSIDVGVAIQLVAAKLVIISILTFLLVSFSRNYRAHRHNQVLAEHRAVTLNSFEQFLQAAKNDDSRDRLLTLVAEAAFNPKQTGYDHADREGGHPMQQILDLHGALNKTN